jgi:glutamate carboxypeptidase
MPSFLDDRVDSDAILEDIRNIVEIESPSRNAAGVNRVLETIAKSFEGTGGAACEREPTTDSLGDILRVRCDPTRHEPGILVLSHMDTVHPVGTLASKLAYRREGDRVYGPGIYDMKGG